MEYVHDISIENYITPISYLDSMYKKSDTNMVKFADKDSSIILEKYYVYPVPHFPIGTDILVYESKYNVSQKIQDVINNNKHLAAKNAFLSFYSVNIGDTELNSYYFSYDLSQTEKISGVSDYVIDEKMKSISDVIHIRFDKDCNFVSVYYNIKIINNEAKNLFLSNLLANEEEKRHILEVVNLYKMPLSIYCTRKPSNNIILYIREIKQ